MSIERAQARFEAVMTDAWPTWFAQLRPGVGNDGMQRLRDAVAPYLVPQQVEAMYRWRNGGDRGVFGGWRMRSLDELIDWYRFACDELEHPRTWVPVFDDQIVNVVTLDLPGLPPSDPSVWYGHTHDIWLHRIFDSIEALLDVVCDAAEGGALAERGNSLGLDVGEFAQALDGSEWSPWRLARSPGSFRWPDPPTGTSLESSAQPTWPREWLEPLGVTETSLTLRGATHTIATLLEEAARGPVRGIIRGRVVTGSGRAGWWDPVVGDGTGQILVRCDTRLCPFIVGVGKEGEFDVVVASAETPEPVVDDDPRMEELVRRIRPELPTAVATAVRPI